MKRRMKPNISLFSPPNVRSWPKAVVYDQLCLESKLEEVGYAMKRFAAAVLLIWPLTGFCDLSDEDPAELCRLLEPFGLVLTEYEVLEGEVKPICLVKVQPTSVADDGFEYSYRVISHHTNDHPKGLFFEISGVASKILGQKPHAQFTEMAFVILSSIYSEEVVAEIILAIESISPGFNRHMVAEGLGIQLRAHDYSQSVASITAGFSIRFDVSNACSFHDHPDLQAKCVAQRKGSLAE